MSNRVCFHAIGQIHPAADNCCMMHGDPADGILSSVHQVVFHHGRHEWVVPRDRIAWTRHWFDLDPSLINKAGFLHTHRGVVCNLHLMGKCTFGADCTRIHVCRRLLHTPVQSEDDAVTPWNVIGKLANLLPTMPHNHYRTPEQCPGSASRVPPPPM